MGLFKKVKDILFDEEEVIEEKVEPKKEVVVNKTEVVEKPMYTEYKPPVVNREEPVQPRVQPSMNTASERDLFKSENAFPFPDFDEDEFDNVRPVQKPIQKPKTKTTNVLEYERNKRKEKKNEYSRLEKVDTVEKKKFKPSPIISPVFGVLNEDYVADDITNRGDPIVVKKDLDVESVRKKAFGSLDEITKKEAYKETETVRSYEPVEEKQQKVRTIDELLEDTSDVRINIDEDVTEEIMIPEIEEPIMKREERRELKEVKSIPVAPDEDDDTLENDLFDLIDSMYDTREDGE